MSGLDMEGRRMFVNLGEENPINAVLFCSWLDPVPLLEFFKDAYPYFEVIKERLIPRTSFLSFLYLSRSNTIAESYRKLTPNGFQLLGFKSTPTYEVLKDFVNEHLRVDQFQDFLSTLVLEIKNLLLEKGAKHGNRCGENASDEQSLKHNPEAKYSGYYKEYGYKFDVAHDLEQETLPLCYIHMEITGRVRHSLNRHPECEHLF